MIRLETATKINNKEFNKIFNAAVDYDDTTGSFPWELYRLNDADNNTKRDFIKKFFTMSNYTSLIVEVREDDNLIALLLGQWHDNNTELLITIALIAPNSDDSKEWILSEEYALARNDYWDRLSINGWTHRTQGEGSPGYNYILRAEELDTLKANYETKLVPLPDASDQFIMPEQHFIDVKLTKL